MTTRAAERVDEWESRPFTDGYEQLRTLADRSFSGAITAGRATLYMVKGTAVGVLDGTIADFEDATGTIYEAPTPALTLLAVMQERSDEVRAKYYSEETPLSEADGKLSEGGFTGYVELSENVLSGDYYVVYQAGKSMSVAFLGESGRLVSGEDAFERADEEVGIYKVRPVAIDPIEIPEPEPPSDDAGAASEGVDTGAAAGGENGDAASEEDDTDGDQPADDASESVESKSDPSRAADTTGETDVPDQGGDRESVTAERNESAAGERHQRGGEHPTDATEPGDEPASTDPPEHETERTSRDDQRHERDSTPAHDDQRHERDSTPAHDDQRHEPERTARDGQQYESERTSRDDQRHERDSTPSGSRESRQSARDAEPRRDRRPPDAESAVTEHVDDSATRAGNAPDSSGDASLERRTIPSVDPDRTWTPDDDRSAGGSQYERPAETPTRGSRQSASSRRRSEQPSPEPEEARAEIDDLEQRIEELEASRSELQAERDDLQAQLQQVRQERDDLQGEVQRLRKEIAELEDRLEAAEASSGSSAAAETPPSTTGSSLSPREAIAGTNLFVRYGSKSDATLSAAHGGGADADAVNANLSLEYHTEFDDSEATVEGEPYESFLEDTIHYRFVEWFVHKLLYEIRDTGHRSALENLYDAIPRVDRVEFAGTVTVGGDDEETPGNESFDVVVRDRMGNPLVVTNLDDSRTATTEEMMTTLVTAATRAGETHDRLAGAFFVTSSFFDPDALETAAEATGGGILSRDKRESFVRLSRKDGFHLCLVESRDDDFHLSVPEL
ncbi:DUF7527 domain-containing protein [Halapricum hydrolyticum]|uniref:DUF7527 domain-containing protein n=1 Tax=Halapricum hydrolyticum TaxID=2979991 RepID=A0AAE3IB10_9EURY|nr:hypothetical protein [Halapricum hydrolyticum]MCU4716567.1 hypothetical protein [Halapricum hydrolyticum]MCU4725828.1 hypothetical protein [Halapricum hydrolyticum]